ncbi:2-isopropylmalate synthase [Atractiella rhizophila]|nr:2-isopropylmalate synthase [Atractiella rhizophila]KAH8919549.1 2-isopropylmalate synthase [Atractiella rhizophila]
MPMLKEPSKKYKPFAFKPPLKDRKWPDAELTAPPRWCSSDLRDGNQSLVNPMSIEQKTKFFNLLVKCGVKEIEVAYPAASDTDFGFVRGLVEGRVHVPNDVWLQVLSPAREDLIRRTFDSLKGAKKAIFHMYNASSCLFREVVFSNDRAQTVELAIKHIKLIRHLVDESIAAGSTTEWQLEYSPETFSQTEPEFVVELCNSVADVWFEGKEREKERPIIFNLPATVEMSTPNHYADQIEYFSRTIAHRSHCVISLHTHNDRGTGVAATELGLLAGGQRVEGCLFGNGERTGNVDLVNLALNFYTQGIDPKLDFSEMEEVVETVTKCNELPVHPRHPYAGELVFTAFSGSHQDAIKKGFKAQKARNDGIWEIPYLPIDPEDIGCNYEAIIRVNSQSGKGGVSYLVQQIFGLDLPRKMQVAFYQVIQDVADKSGREITTEDIEKSFRSTYFLGEGHEGRFTLVDYSLSDASANTNTLSTSPSASFQPSSSVQSSSAAKKTRHLRSTITDNGKTVIIEGTGNGPVSSILDALNAHAGMYLNLREYSEHTIAADKSSSAASYIELVDENGKGHWGVGVDEDVAAASLKAVLSAGSSAWRVNDDTKANGV